MWIFICGGFRTGSVLQYNLVAELVKRTNTGISLGFKRPQGFSTIADQYTDRKEYVVFKSHELTPEIEAEFKKGNAICLKTIRDFRDVVVSLAHKKDLTYDFVIKKRLKRHLNMFYPWLKIDEMFVSRYEEFVFDLKNEIYKIAEYLKIDVTPEIVEEIYEKCNLDSHKKYINNIDYSKIKFDPKTMLHPNHINDGKSEQWKTKLTAEQILEIEKVAGEWLIENNYELSSKRDKV